MQSHTSRSSGSNRSMSDRDMQTRMQLQITTRDRLLTMIEKLRVTSNQ